MSLRAKLNEDSESSGRKKRKRDVVDVVKGGEMSGRGLSKRVTRSSKEKGLSLHALPLKSTGKCGGGDSDCPVLPLKLYKIDKMPKYGRLDCYSKLEYLLVITKSLRGTKELEWLKDSQFGSLFKITVSMCGMSGKLMHQLLCISIWEVIYNCRKV